MSCYMGFIHLQKLLKACKFVWREVVMNTYCVLAEKAAVVGQVVNDYKILWTLLRETTACEAYNTEIGEKVLFSNNMVVLA
jgi:hypothetical protein